MVVLFLMDSNITRPVNRLARATKKIQEGKFDSIVAHNTRDEVGQLTDAFNEMLCSLEVTQKNFYNPKS